MMKTTAIYGVKRRSLLIFIPALALLLCGGALLAARILLGYPYISYFVGMAFVGGLYLSYLAAYEAYFRYRTLVSVEGKDVEATLTHISENTGTISRHVLARYEENGMIIEGRLYASFDKAFVTTYRDGDHVKVRLLKTQEFLLYASQNPKSPQNPHQ
ncbi:MAG: hypothetical protein WCS90_02675 [Bacilli bacterium]